MSENGLIVSDPSLSVPLQQLFIKLCLCLMDFYKSVLNINVFLLLFLSYSWFEVQFARKINLLYRLSCLMFNSEFRIYIYNLNGY